MKNIEKYPNTDAALKAYSAYKGDRIGGIPFERWLDLEVAEREPTLIEAAEDYLHAVQWDTANVKALAIALGDAIIREKRKPVRNVDKYKTAEEAHKAFVEMCESHKFCEDCPVVGGELRTECAIAWLYAEAEAGKEAVTK